MLKIHSPITIPRLCINPNLQALGLSPISLGLVSIDQSRASCANSCQPGLIGNSPYMLLPFDGVYILSAYLWYQTN